MSLRNNIDALFGRQVNQKRGTSNGYYGVEVNYEVLDLGADDAG